MCMLTGDCNEGAIHRWYSSQDVVVSVLNFQYDTFLSILLYLIFHVA